jgi:hypothetical protein
VSDVDLEQTQWSLRGIVYLRVQYGGGLIKTITANVGTSRGGVVALDATLRIAVGNVLSDPEIQRFL